MLQAVCLIFLYFLFIRSDFPFVIVGATSESATIEVPSFQPLFSNI
jgi:hypothetical protein